jgi:two-component system sensor histidine kinase HupT/HoxJ
LEQVLVNVILNSIESLSRGGEIHIMVEPDSTAGIVQLYIDDNGPGVSEENLDSIFDPFFTTRVRGVGLGLSISKRIVEQHKGNISVHNSPQGGARIKISLPLHQAEA